MKERFNSLSQKKVLYMIYCHIFQRIKLRFVIFNCLVELYITYIFHKRNDYQNFFQNKQIFFFTFHYTDSYGFHIFYTEFAIDQKLF